MPGPYVNIPTAQEALASELHDIAWRLYTVLSRSDLNGDDAHELHRAYKALGELIDALKS